MKKYMVFFMAVIAMLVASCGKESSKDNIVHVETVILSKHELTLELGAEAGIKATILPVDATDKEVHWLSSAPEVATIDSYGIIKALTEGETIITGEVDGVKDACVVTVKGVEVLDVKISKRSMGVLLGQSKTLEADVYPENATSELVWSSSNKTVASVDENGVVTGVKLGVATIKATAGNVEASCQVTVMAQPAECDYYYSDGTWSATLYPGKTAMGVVFWVGDPTASDPTLKKDHPECTHGLVVGLEEEYTSWQKNVGYVGESIKADFPEFVPPYATGGDSNFNRIIGYNNTKAMEKGEAQWPLEGASPQIELVQRVQAYNKRVALPEETSGWYCPSPKELSLLCNGEYDGDIYSIGKYMGEKERIAHLETIKMALDRISGSTTLSEFYYWSSTEDKDDVTCAFYMSFGWGDFSRYDKTDNGRRLRYIFAF